VAIDEGGKESSVNKTGKRDVGRSRGENTNGFFSVPSALNVKAILVQPPASIAVTQVVRIKILKCLLL
jgi:hypothetical protein